MFFILCSATVVFGVRRDTKALPTFTKPFERTTLLCVTRRATLAFDGDGDGDGDGDDGNSILPDPFAF